MALSGVAHGLRTALARLSEPANRADQFDDASELAELVRQAKAIWPAANEASKAEVTELLLDIGDALGTPDGKLSTALAAQHSEEAASALRAQFGYAVAVLDRCCTLACMAQLSAEEMAWFAQSGALLVGGSSKAVLSHWLRHSAAAMRQSDAQQRAEVHSRSTVPQQLQAASKLLRLLSSHESSSGLAAFAANVWRPGHVTRWLSSVLVVVQAAKAAGCLASVAPLASVCATLLTHSAFEAQQAAVQASLALQSALVALLPGVMQVAASYLDMALRAAEEEGGSDCSGTGSSAGSTAAALADYAMGSADAREWTQVAVSCLQLVMAPCLESGVQYMAAAGAAEQHQHQHQHQHEQQLQSWLAKSTALLQAIPAQLLSSTPAAQFAQLLLLAVAAATRPCYLAARAAEQPGNATQAAFAALTAQMEWSKHATVLLPHLARVMALLQHDSELAAQLAAQPPGLVAAACGGVAVVADKSVAVEDSLAMAAWQAGIGVGSTGMQRLADAATIGEAAVTLMYFAAELPLLAARASQPGQLGAAAAQLADSCQTLANTRLFALAAIHGLLAGHNFEASSLCAELRQHRIPAQLRWVHTQGCRFAHYVAAATEQQLAAVPALSNWPAMSACGTAPFRGIAELELGPAAGLWDARELVGIAVAEAEAQLVNLEMLRNRRASVQDMALHFGGAVESLVLVYVLRGVPHGHDAAVRHALIDTLRYQLQNLSRAPEAAADNCSFTLRHAVQCPELAAALVGSGLLADVLQVTQARLAAAGRKTRQQVAALPASALATLESLREAACKAAQAPSAGQEASERCESAAAWLEAALQAEEARLPADLEKLYATKLEPAAQEAAAALEAVWEAPEISNERLLQLAQGAATRGCAYLRCPNVGAGGGAGPGQQQGSSRCSACRAFWYCGTACSHADWRAGHRRTCKALAAARQADKAAAAEQQEA